MKLVPTALAVVVAAALLSVPPAIAGECRDLVDAGRIPPRSDEDCAMWDEGRRKSEEARAAQEAADMPVVEAYFSKNPNVPRPASCGTGDDWLPGALSDCRREVERMSQIDAYFDSHPKARRPDECSLPLRSGFLGACSVWIENAEAGPEPQPEWHRLNRDTVACYQSGIYGNGEYLGSSEGCIEVHAGQVFLLRAASSVGEDGKRTWLKPLSTKEAVASNGATSLMFRSDAFDRKILRCRAKAVLLHQEVTCDRQ